jgi:hypothetical protein
MNGTGLEWPVAGSGIEPLGFGMIKDLYRGKNEFNRGYQPRSNLLKKENADLLPDSHNILKRWKNYSELLNIHRVIVSA